MSGRQLAKSVNSWHRDQSQGDHCKKVVKVMHQVCNTILIQNYPFHHICHGIKNVRCRAETEGEGQIDKELATPLYPQKIPILWLNCDMIRSLHVERRTSSLSSGSNFSCSKQEPLSLTHQPNFETFSPDFFLCGAFFELPCEQLVSLSSGIEETNCSQDIFKLASGHELLRFFDIIYTDVW